MSEISDNVQQQLYEHILREKIDDLEAREEQYEARIAELEAHIAALEEAYARKLKSGTTFPIFQNRRR